MKLLLTGGIRLLLPLLLLPALWACGQKEKEEEKKPVEPTVFAVYGTTNCAAVTAALTVTVQCDIDWTATLESDWVKIQSRTAETGGGQLFLQVEVNRTDEARTATLVVAAGSKSIQKTITQQGLDSFFQPSEVHLAGLAERTLRFSAPSSWIASVTEGADWIELKTPSGEAGEASLVLAAKDPNENVGDRSGSLRITIGGEDFSIPVVQSQKDVILADNANVSFDYKGGDFVVHTQSNVSYAIECGADWVHYVETKALNEATEYFTVDANGTINERETTVRFTPKQGDAKSVSITVKQAGKERFLFITAPGFYAIDGQSYFLGNNGWNLSSRVQHADGSAEFRLLNRSANCVLSVRGYDPAAEEGSAVHLYVDGWQKGNKFLIKEYDATVLASTEDRIWLQCSGLSGFIVQK